MSGFKQVITENFRSRRFGILLAVIVMLFSIYALPRCLGQLGTKENQPVVVSEEKNYLGAVRDYAISGDHLYLLLDERRILMQYDLSGRFEQSYAVKHSGNGNGKLYLNGKQLCWVADRYHYYFFCDGEYQKLAPELAQQMGHEIELSRAGSEERPRIATDGSEYVLKWGSVWRVHNGNQEKIISRPLWFSLFDSTVAFIIAGIAFVFVMLCAFIRLLRSNKGRYVIGLISVIAWGILLIFQHLACVDILRTDLWYLYILALIFGGLCYLLVYSAGKQSKKGLLRFYFIVYVILALTEYAFPAISLLCGYWIPSTLDIWCATLNCAGAVLSILWLKQIPKIDR